MLRQITATPEYSFLVRKDVGGNMINNWHYHPEIELLFIQRSVGTSQNRSLPGQSTGSQRSCREVALRCRENTQKGYEPTNRIVSPLFLANAPLNRRCKS